MIKATDTHSEYVILMTFSRQLWLRERVNIRFIRAFLHQEKLYGHVREKNEKHVPNLSKKF